MIERTVVYNNDTKEEQTIEVELTQEEVDKRQQYLTEIENGNLIQEAKTYLNNTDYVIIKMYENFVQGESVIQMLSEYADVFKKRKEARKTINELEK